MEEHFLISNWRKKKQREILSKDDIFIIYVIKYYEIKILIVIIAFPIMQLRYIIVTLFFCESHVNMIHPC